MNGAQFSAADDHLSIVVSASESPKQKMNDISPSSIINANEKKKTKSDRYGFEMYEPYAKVLKPRSDGFPLRKREETKYIERILGKTTKWWKIL